MLRAGTVDVANITVYDVRATEPGTALITVTDGAGGGIHDSLLVGGDRFGVDVLAGRAVQATFNTVHAVDGAAFDGLATGIGRHENADDDPLFLDPEAEDFGLLRRSPAVDTGRSSSARCTLEPRDAGNNGALDRGTGGHRGRVDRLAPALNPGAAAPGARAAGRSASGCTEGGRRDAR